ncbi:hypothetical protein HYT18_01585 [Candidatus Microgenomates bacterium]|nr:hypothetical protein [Candidatus Microgenomates bacterium]
MPKLSGLFDSFDNLDQIPIENIARWIKTPMQPHQMENYLANRILYPQTIAVSQLDMQIDLAILREAVRLNGPWGGVIKGGNNLLGDNPFLNITLRKLLIPAKFLKYCPDLITCVWVFVDALLLDRQKEDWFADLWTVVLTDDLDEVVGSILLPQFDDSKAIMQLQVEGKTFKIKPGSLVVVPCPKNRCEIAFKLDRGKILGQKMSQLQIYGGRLGLVIDGRVI